MKPTLEDRTSSELLQKACMGIRYIFKPFKRPKFRINRCAARGYIPDYNFFPKPFSETSVSYDPTKIRYRMITGHLPFRLSVFLRALRNSHFCDVSHLRRRNVTKVAF